MDALPQAALGIFSKPKDDADRCALIIDTLNHKLSIPDGESVVWMDMYGSYYSATCLNPWYPIVCTLYRCVMGCQRFEGWNPTHPQLKLDWDKMADQHRKDKVKVIKGLSLTALLKSLSFATQNAIDIHFFQECKSIRLPKECTLHKDNAVRIALLLNCLRQPSIALDGRMFGRAVELSLLFACNLASYSTTKSNSTAILYATLVLSQLNTTAKIVSLIKSDPAMFSFVTRVGLGSMTTSVHKCNEATARLPPAAFDLTKLKSQVDLHKAANLFVSKCIEWGNLNASTRGALRHEIPKGCLAEKEIEDVHHRTLKAADSLTGIEAMIGRAQQIYSSAITSGDIMAEYQIADAFLRSMQHAVAPKDDYSFKTPIEFCPNIQTMRASLQENKLGSTQEFVDRQLPPPTPYYHLSPQRIQIDLKQSRRTLLRAILYASALGLIVGDLRRIRSRRKSQENGRLLRGALKKLQGYLKYLSKTRYAPALIITMKESWIMNPPNEWSVEDDPAAVRPPTPDQTTPAVADETDSKPAAATEAKTDASLANPGSNPLAADMVRTDQKNPTDRDKLIESQALLDNALQSLRTYVGLSNSDMYTTQLEATSQNIKGAIDAFVKKIVSDCQVLNVTLMLSCITEARQRVMEMLREKIKKLGSINPRAAEEALVLVKKAEKVSG